MTHPDPFDVVVVGGGVIGMACAEALSRRKLHVCIVEKDELGRAASWAGGGLLSPLPPDQCADALRPLLEESLALYPEWCERLHRESGIDPEYWVCGGDYYKRSGEHIEYPRMAQVRNPRLVKALAETLRRRGVIMLTQTTARGWIRNDDAVSGVRTTRGDVHARASILSAGAWSADLGANGVEPVKGQMLLLGGTPGALPRACIGDDVYLIPRRDGKILAGSTLEHQGFDLSLSESVRDDLYRRAQRIWPGAESLPVIGHWAGLRPYANREAPLLQAVEGQPGLYVATGHYRLGITLAPASAVRIEKQLQL